MNSEHNIKDLDLLYADAKKLISEVVGEKIDSDILKNIDKVISNLNEFWHGQDAIVQINKLIDIKNLLLDNRDIVGNIGSYVALLAKNYRDAQNANTTILPSFPQIEYRKIAKNQKVSDNTAETYMNSSISNTIGILNNTVGSLEELNNTVISIKNSIMNNWIQEDENRSFALKMLDSFTENSLNIIKNLNESIKCINTSIDNYNVSVTAVSSMPSLESMFDNGANVSEKEYSVEEKKILGFIEKNFADNKKVTEDFNNKLVNEVKSDLRSKGILE